MKKFVGLLKEKKFRCQKSEISKDLTINDIESELERISYNEKYLKVLKNTFFSLTIIVAITIIVATLIMPVLKLNGSSMEGTYNHGDILALLKTKRMKNGDVIAFYHGNKILVKRVIAQSGNWVTIDKDGNVYIDGKKQEEPYIEKKELGEYDIEFPYQVPDGEYFVLSDKRSDVTDSRNKIIGSIAKENIIGKIIFRIWPLF